MDNFLAMEKIPYFSENNVDKEFYKQFSQLRNILTSRTEQDVHQLNPRNVTGVWFLTEMSCDGNPQLILRSNIKRRTYERMLLSGEIFDIVPHDVAYDYDDIFIDKDLVKEIKEGRLLTIYNKG